MAIIMDKKSSFFVLVVVVMGAFLIPFMGAALNVSLPSIGKEFSLNLVILGWIPTSFILANAAFILPFGRLGDIYGRKKIFRLGVVLFTLSSLMAFFSPSANYLIFFSFMLGLGCSMIFATGMAILSSVFPIDSRGESFGIYVASVYMGLLAGPLLGGFLTESLGWRSIFLFNIPLGIIILLFIFLKIKKDWIGSKGETFDLKGTLIYVPAIIMISYGVTNAIYLFGQLLVVAGILFLLGFLFMELKIKNPLINPLIFKKMVPLLSSTSNLLLLTSTSGVWTLLSLYLQYIQVLSPFITGIILAIQPIVVVIASPFAGRLSDRINGGPLTLLGIILSTTGLFMSLFIGSETAIAMIIILTIVLGLGNALFSSPNTNIFISSVDKKFYGSASAVFATVIFTGQLLSMGIILLVFSDSPGALGGMASQFKYFINSLHLTFTIYLILSILGSILILVMVLKQKNSKIKKLYGN